MDISGVTPLPAPTNSSFLEGYLKQLKLPQGLPISTRSPSLRLSASQFDTRPSGTRLIVNSRAWGLDGEEDKLYERVTVLPSI